ncbi:MAG: hypothetical protein IIZ27_09210, partial [Solobacterium sp.]|nr:hypothetical protein [Solobacterium sp.]
VSLGHDNLTIPIDMTVILDNHEKKDQSDNEVYVSVGIPMLGVENYQMWIKDNVMYVDDGQSKRYTPYEPAEQTAELSAEDFVSKVFSDIDNSVIEEDGDETTIAVTVNKEGLQEYFEELAETASEIDDSTGMVSSVGSIMDDITFDDVRVTLDKSNHVVRVTFGGTLENSELQGNITTDILFSEYNTAVIPAFDPDEFVDSSLYEETEDFTVEEIDTDGEEFVDDYTVIIDFSDDSSILIHTPEEQGVYCYFNDEDQTLYIFDDQEFLAQGFFLEYNYTESIIDEFASLKEDYKSIDEKTLSPGITQYRGISLKETDVLNADTPYMLMLFEKGDIGLFMAGLTDEETFFRITDAMEYQVPAPQR